MGKHSNVERSASKTRKVQNMRLGALINERVRWAICTTPSSEQGRWCAVMSPCIIDPSEHGDPSENDTPANRQQSIASKGRMSDHEALAS